MGPTQPQDNPLIPPGQGNPMLPPGMMPPPIPPPPPSPALGFQTWASDPRNAMKVQHSMVAPDAPLQPNAGNAMTPPAAAPMASVNPPQQPNAMIPPGQQTPSPMGAPPPAIPAMPDAPMAKMSPMQPPAVQSQLGADTGELQRLQKTGSGISQVKNPWLKGLGMAGDFAASALLGKGAASIPGTTARNQLLQGQQRRVIGDDREAIASQFTGQQNAANLAHTQVETAAIPINSGLKAQAASASLAQHGLKVEVDENGLTHIVPDEDSPAYQQQQLQQGLVKAHTESYAATNELHAAQAAFAKAKNDPNSPVFRQTAARLATAQANAGAAQQRAQAYMGNYLMHSQNTDLSGNTLAGAPVISDDEGNQTVVGSTNAATAIKSQGNAAQFNDVHGALDNLEGTAKALVSKGGSVSSPGIAAALAQPAGTLGKWLQGAGVKANLTPEERAYVQSVASAHENIQALRKSAGGTATDSAVEKLDSMIPNASTPDLNYLLGQTGQIRATATRLGKGATVAAGGLSVKGQGNAPKANNMIPPTQRGASAAPTTGPQVGTVEDGHRFKGGNPSDPSNWEVVKK